MIEEREKKTKKEKVAKQSPSQEVSTETERGERRDKGEENTSVQLEESAVYLSMREMRVGCVCVSCLRGQMNDSTAPWSRSRDRVQARVRK